MSDVVSAYLGLSPFERLLNQKIPFVIPDETRYRGAYVVAPSGRGKTTLLKAFIAQDLLKVAKGEASIVVMNSDRDLIDDIAKLKAFAPGQPLHGKLVLLEPDMDYPLALNLFAMGKDRFDKYDAN